MARFCANEDCDYWSHPLPERGGKCPGCGSAQSRLKPEVSTVACSACDRLNEAGATECWACGASMGQHRALG